MQYSGPDHDPAADEAERIHPIIQEAAERMIEKDFGGLWELLLENDSYVNHLFDAASAAQVGLDDVTLSCINSARDIVKELAFNACWDNRDEIVRAYDERKADERAGV